MANYYTLTTKIGQAKIANAVALGQQIELTAMAVGDGNGQLTVPNENRTALVNEVFRAQINNLTVDTENQNYLIAEMIVPTNVGGWSINEVGVFAADGELFAIANFPLTYKPVIAEGSGRDLVIRIVMAVTNAEAVTLKVDPAVILASQAWVVENFTRATLLPGGFTGQFLAKKSDANGDTEWKNVIIPEQVNADWNAVSGKAQILHKPNLATVATSGSYNDLSGKPDLSVKADKTQLSAYLPLTGGTINGNLVFGNGSVSLSRGNYEVTDFDLGLRRSPYQRFTFINNEADADFDHVSVVFAGYDTNNKARYAFTRRGEIVCDVDFDGAYLGRYKIPALIESSKGVNWYRRWSDGWLEQGGYFSASDGLQSLVFQLPYKNGDYTLTIGTIRSAVNTSNVVIQDKLQSYFNILATDGAAGNWFAAGWGV